MNVRPVFAWYDLWIGCFWDRKARQLYILPIPCIGIVIDFRPSDESPRPKVKLAIFDDLTDDGSNPPIVLL